ncbi:MAG: response regulator [Hungatella sp.]|jgi:signal transduction histidine kinase/CheY-like chemotaxis protein|nr:response regulator [Hungatella sp.]
MGDEKRYECIHAVMNEAPFAFSIFDKNFRFLECNREKLFLHGVADSKECLRRFWEFIPEFQPDGLLSRDKWTAMMRRTMDIGRVSFEWEYVNGNRKIPVKIKLAKISAGGGTFLVMYERNLLGEKKYINDLLAVQKDMEEAYRNSVESENAKSRFFAMMSHELRSPLQAIIGAAELMFQKEISEVGKGYLTLIQQSGYHLLGIINEILEFSSIQSGKIEVDCDSYTMSSLISEIKDMITVLLIGSPVTFSVRADNRIPEKLKGDKRHIKQVLINILNNAVKYTPEGYIELSISFRRQGDDQIQLSFAIKDTGVGIRQEDMGKLFQEFGRLNEGKQIGGEGNGLGLFVVREISQALGGDIRVSSEYGTGSEFVFQLVQSVEDEQKLAWVGHGEGKQVLIFEEKPDQASSLLYALNCLGLQTCSVKSREEFQKEISGGAYDYGFAPAAVVFDCEEAGILSACKTRLVCIMDFDDRREYRFPKHRIRQIWRPLYCVNVADIINRPWERVSECSLKTAGNSSSALCKRVLIVDDMPVNLRITGELIRTIGIEADTCMSGYEAISLMKEKHYDIVFLDYMMPGMDGIATAWAMRAMRNEDPFYGRLPIIALTANSFEGQMDYLEKNGINDFLTKPVSISDLKRILCKWFPEFDVSCGVKGAKAGTMEKLLEIPEVSALDGLRNVGGSMEAYLDILSDFCRMAGEYSSKIRQNMSGGRRQEFVVCVHALKGAARGIGAFQFSKYAETLEEQVCTGKLEKWQEDTEWLLSKFKKLTLDIKEALKFWEEEKCDEDNISILHLDLLKKALEEMDIHTINSLIVGYKDLTPRSAARRVFGEIEPFVLLFDYEGAGKKIDQIMKEKVNIYQ